MDKRKIWTAQQDQLRKALSSRTRFPEAIGLFLSQHAAVHCAAVSIGSSWSLQDEVLTGISESTLKTVPAPGKNSIAWLLWHITRIEDMTINLLTLDQDPVWNLDWAERLGISSPDCGAGMDADDVTIFSANISANALLAYRYAVGLRTQACIPNLSAVQAQENVANTIVQKLVDDGSINADKANWLFEYYCNRKRTFFLTRTATSHNFIHLNEAGRVRAKLTRT